MPKIQKPKDVVQISVGDRVYSYSPSTGRLFVPEGLRAPIVDLKKEHTSFMTAQQSVIEMVVAAVARHQAGLTEKAAGVWKVIEADLKELAPQMHNFVPLKDDTVYSLNPETGEIMVDDKASGENPIGLPPTLN